MRKAITSIIVYFIGCQSFAQSLKDLSFGTNETFEVLTWNIEWFPKNGQMTVDSVGQIIRALDVDLLALQEISDTTILKGMVATLEGYEGYFKSDWYAGLAYVYKPEIIDIISIYEIYTTSPYWSAFPRAPMVMEMRYMNHNIIVINNHFKCCGNGILELNDADDEETRRYEASILLKQYIDTNFPNEKVIVLGDLNDILTDNPDNNVFQSFIDDSSNFRFADMEIATGSISGWSYPNWPSHIDHILITNELFTDFSHDSSDVKTISIDSFLTGGFVEYDSNISDHRPVGLKLKTANALNSNEIDFRNENLIIYPNPARGTISVTFNPQSEFGVIDIYDMSGNNVEQFNIHQGQSTVTWNTGYLPSGIYIVKLTSDSGIKAIKKFVLLK